MKKTMFDGIIEKYYKPIQKVEGYPISYGSLANGNWGYLLMKLDGFNHFNTEDKARVKWEAYLNELLKEQETDNQLPW